MKAWRQSADGTSSVSLLYLGKFWKVVEKKGLPRKSTTTNRRYAKKSTTFCDFLLTGNLHPLILRDQIRESWKRQTDPVGGAFGPFESANHSGFQATTTSAKYLLRARKFEAEQLLSGRAKITGPRQSIRVFLGFQPAWIKGMIKAASNELSKSGFERFYPEPGAEQ
jgi:hypothetical protein